MRNKSVLHTIMELSKDIEMHAYEREYEIFPGRDEINLELAAFGEYINEKIEGYDLEDSYQN